MAHVRVTSWRFISIAVLGLSLLCGFASARSSVIDTAVRKIPLWRAERLHTDIALCAAIKQSRAFLGVLLVQESRTALHSNEDENGAFCCFIRCRR